MADDAAPFISGVENSTIEPGGALVVVVVEVEVVVAAVVVDVEVVVAADAVEAEVVVVAEENCVQFKITGVRNVNRKSVKHRSTGIILTGR